MPPQSIYRASASEFPHDNPEFDRGALWIGSPLCRLTPEPPFVMEEEDDERSGIVERPAALVSEHAPVDIEPDDLLEELALAEEEGAILPPVSELVSGEATNDVAVEAGAVIGDSAVEEIGAPIGDSAIEAADAIADVAEAAPQAPSEIAQEAPGAEVVAEQGDPFGRLIDAVADVALSHGTPAAGALARALLAGGLATAELDPEIEVGLVEGGMIERRPDGPCESPTFAATIAAWRSVLRGEGDLSACGDQTLDTWATEIVCRVMRPAPSVATVRREIRRRGIAAFGLLD
jgi:hypothetical protein